MTDKVLTSRLIVILIAASMLISLLPGSLIAAPLTSRADATMDFSVGGGYDDSFKVTIPRNATVLTATMDLTGIAMGEAETTVTYNFTDTTNNTAWFGSTTSGDASGLPSGYQEAVFTALNKTNVSASDDEYANTEWMWPDNSGRDVRAYHHFQFKLDASEANNMTFLWEGWGWCAGGSPQSADLFLYNYTDSDWVKAAWYNNPDGLDHNLTKSYFSDIDDYFSGNDELDMVIIGPPRAGMNDMAAMLTDYVHINTTSGGMSFPTDITMDVGNDGSVDWSPAGSFEGTTAVGDSQGLKGLLQAEVDEAGAGTGDVDIYFNFTSAAQGRLEISNLVIEYNLPPSTSIIPDTYDLDEDTDATGLIDLDGYFEDDGGDAALVYKIVYEEDDTKIDAEIGTDGHSLDFTTPTLNWFGAMGFKVKASDALGRSIVSNTFNVSVNSVNDEPYLIPILPQIATQGTLFTKVMTANDNDTNFDPAETPTFSDDSELFDINGTSGVIAFMPTNDDVGEYNITITVTDAHDADDSEVLNLKVKNRNDGPTIDPITDKEVLVGNSLTFTATAHDIDDKHGEKLTFTDNTELFDIEPVTGVVDYTPVADDVGVHRVTITVTDEAGDHASAIFNLTVKSEAGTMNRPPVLDIIEDQVATEDQVFTLQLTGLDPDGDPLTFSDDCMLFEINSTTGAIEFTPTNDDVGVHNVTVTLKDTEGSFATIMFNIAVENVNDPPTALILKPGHGDKFKKKQEVVLQGQGEDVDVGDELNYTWKNGEEVLGYGQEINTSFLSSGKYNITLEVTDLAGAKGKAYVNITIKKAPKSEGLLPGFDTTVAAASIGVVAVLVAFFRRRGDGGR